MRASPNLALDVIRREKVFRGKEAEIVRLIEASGSSVPQAASFPEKKSQTAGYGKMFVAVSDDSPGGTHYAGVKTLCGFSVAEVSQ